MSKYNYYATKLDRAFQEAATSLRSALEACEQAEKNRGVKYRGEADYQRAKMVIGNTLK